MGRFAVSLGVTIYCAMTLTGCISLPSVSQEASKADVQILSSREVRECRFLGDVTTEGSFPQDQDAMHAATQRAQDQAVSKGGNAIFIQSMTAATSNSPAKPTTVTVIAAAYACAQSKAL